MIEALSISHRIGSATLLEDVSLAVSSGEVLVLVGPNGAGKSTLLRILAGEIAPTAGTVTLAGRPSSEWSARKRAELRAVLPQQSELSFPFSCYEVVLLGRTPHTLGHESQKDHAITRLAMAVTDTRGYEERAYPTLSGGERQRVHAGRVLAQIWEGPSFRALLLDEPTASLDLAHQHAMLRLARRMADDQCAVVCVLHDLNLAAQYATTLAVMHRGRLHAVGRPARVLSPRLLADVFEVDALVVPHPELSCPMVVTRGPLERKADSPSLSSPASTPSNESLQGGLP
ncbi:MAG: heme ABC transporter ATP-binding protein [Labilithrix sp.]|nr:heme ABC transporter ATP-binding protein [Labilithrix sp.]MBX3219059.1 heme ABC transporter ATP-binding protein [Labilithrix sp.]